MKTPELDLHGLTLDEAFAEVDRELNHLFCQETENRRIRVITGWGSIIRPQIQQFLNEHPLIKEIKIDGAAVEVNLEDAF